MIFSALFMEGIGVRLVQLDFPRKSILSDCTISIDGSLCVLACLSFAFAKQNMLLQMMLIHHLLDNI